MEIDEAARVFTDPKAYADEQRFHAACARCAGSHRAEASADSIRADLALS